MVITPAGETASPHHRDVVTYRAPPDPATARWARKCVSPAGETVPDSGWAWVRTGRGGGATATALTVSVYVHVPAVSPAVSVSVPDTVHVPVARGPAVLTAPPVETVTPHAVAGVVAKLTEPFPVVASWSV